MFSLKRFCVAFVIAAGAYLPAALFAQVSNPGVQQAGAVFANDCVKWGPGLGQVQSTGAPCAAGVAVTSVGAASPGATITIGGTNPVTGSGTINFDLPVKITGASVGSATTAPVITFDNYGRATSIGSATIAPPFTAITGSLACGQFPALTGDVTATAGSCATTLATIVSAAGPLGSATVAPIVTIDAKGRVTALSSATIAPPFSAVTGNLTLAQFPSLASNTFLGNVTAGSAVPTAFAMSACAADGNHALTYTTNTGFVCSLLLTTPNAQTGTTYSLVAADCGTFITFSNAGAIAITLNLNATTAITVGCQIDGAQLGAGKPTIAPAGGVTLNSIGGNKAFSAQYAAWTLKKLATDTWLLVGSIGP